MVCGSMRSALIASVVVVLFDTSSSLLVTFGKKSKPASNLQLEQNSGEPCATEADCSTLPDTSCIQTGVGRSECLCEDMEPPRLGRCMLMQKDLQIACTDGQDCINHGIVDKSIECRNSTCHCKVGYFAIENADSCEQVTFIDEVASGSSTTFSVFLLLVTSITGFLAGSGYCRL
ncbi:uncharacterized protein LOC135710808 [Ochlerotatus camptorhynchus]|uniref:uncharacterized protein LOC135710808 n=1 Tax=Ochlerotatus camptorhynchus TaxID=644619 RepID=UPI0031D02844